MIDKHDNNSLGEQMLQLKERKLIVEYGKKLVSYGLIRGTGGNLSIYNREEGLISISPSGTDYLKTKPGDIPVLDINNKIIEGKRKPSSELDMHMVFYNHREDINAIVHTHSVFATTLACLKREIPPVHYLVGFAGNRVGCAEYATFGTKELAENAFRSMAGRKAVLLANHGLLAAGADLKQAFNIAEIIEFCAEVYYRTQCTGDPSVLSDEEMDLVMEKFKTYGQAGAKA